MAYNTAWGSDHAEDFKRRMEEFSAREAAIRAHQMTFVETEHCDLACSDPDATQHTAACRARAACPVRAALAGWLEAVKVAA